MGEFYCNPAQPSAMPLLWILWALCLCGCVQSSSLPSAQVRVKPDQDHGPPPGIQRDQELILSPGTHRDQTALDHSTPPGAHRDQTAPDHSPPPGAHRDQDHSTPPGAHRDQTAPDHSPPPGAHRDQTAPDHSPPPGAHRDQTAPDHSPPPGAHRDQDHSTPLGAHTDQDHSSPLAAHRDQDHSTSLGAQTDQDHSSPLGAHRDQNHSPPPGAHRDQDCSPPLGAHRDQTALNISPPAGAHRGRTRRSITQSEMLAILDYHNQVRAHVYPPAANMELMQWDTDLAQWAEVWAASCQWEHGPAHLLSFYGQNLSVRTGGYQSVLQLVTPWFEEVFYYVFPYAHMCNPLCPLTCYAPMCTHYTQMVWASTSRVGCALHTCSNMSVWGSVWREAAFLVCNYSPKGNWIGEAPYKVGVPCSMCPNTYRGRCSSNLCVPEPQSNYVTWFK